MKLEKRPDSGQTLIAAILVSLLLGIFVSALLFYSQSETFHTVTIQKETNAFHMAETAIERGYWRVSLDTNVINDIPLSGYNFDQEYTDAATSGTYTIYVGSDASKNIIITGIGRDPAKGEVRTLKAIYANALSGNNAVEANSGEDSSGNNMTVEWGAVMSESTMTANTSHLHPSLWAVGAISPLDSDPNPPNCDSPNCWWWHSFDKNLPPFPNINFSYYQQLAQNAGPSPCGGNYYTNGNRSGSCSDTTGHTYYVTGNWTGFDGPISSNVIVMGNVTTPNGAMSGQSISASMPTTAWRQYCNDWSYYLTTYNDAYANAHYATACPGLNSTYVSASTITYSISPVVQGFMYVGGNFTGPNGGGNTTLMYGVLMVKGTVFLNSNSHVKIFYNANTSSSIQTTSIVLTRTSWQELMNQKWPSGLP